MDARGDDGGVYDYQFLTAQVHFNSSLEDVDRKFTFVNLDFVHRATDTERVGDRLDAGHVSHPIAFEIVGVCADSVVVSAEGIG